MALTDDPNVRETRRMSMYEGTSSRIPVEEQRPREEPLSVEEQERMSRYAVAGGSAIEGLAGLAGVILGIVGLVGYYRIDMLSIAAIVLGGALLLESLALGARFAGMAHRVEGRWLSGLGIGFGSLATFVAGGGSLILGLLALFGRFPMTMNPVALIVLGGGLILGSTAHLGLARTHWGWSDRAVADPKRERMHQFALGAVLASGGLQVLCGLAGVTLGILALEGISPILLTLVGMIVIGGCIFLSGSALVSKQAIELR